MGCSLTVGVDKTAAAGGGDGPDSKIETAVVAIPMPTFNGS